jgi:hypothetical protein
MVVACRCGRFCRCDAARASAEGATLLRPHSVLRIKGMRFSMEISAPQHMKIMCNGSSRIGSSPNVSFTVVDKVHSLSRYISRSSANVRRVRSRRMARFRAVVSSQPAGLSGIPSSDHEFMAATKDSYRTSSARSRFCRPKMRVRTEIRRPAARRRATRSHLSLPCLVPSLPTGRKSAAGVAPGSGIGTLSRLEALGLGVCGRRRRLTGGS